jgi:hypothetical protein
MIFFKLLACFFIIINSINCNKRNKEIQVFNQNSQYDEDFLNALDNQLDQNPKKKITLVNTSTEIQDGLHESSSDKRGQLRNKYKLKIDVEFDLDDNVKSLDKCSPSFDKKFYEFDVVENIIQLIEPIYVDDCDQGINGFIYLSTNNPDFVFKLDKIYRHSKVGIQMMRSYIYEDETLKTEWTKKTNEKYIEFEIYAKGSNASVNKFHSKALVRVNIENKNSYMPEFVLPTPIYYLKDGMPTMEKQKIYSYKVPENKDFVLVAKAVDDDNGLDGKLTYTVRYLDSDDTFEVNTEIEQNLNETGEHFRITVPGKYLDSHSKSPIMFAIRVEDYGTPKLNNEIIIYLRPQSVELMPIYFEFDRYEFNLVENMDYVKQPPVTVRLINDNIVKTTIRFEEVRDPLNLITFGFDDRNNAVSSFATNHEILKYLSPLLQDPRGKYSFFNFKINFHPLSFVSKVFFSRNITSLTLSTANTWLGSCPNLD